MKSCSRAESVLLHNVVISLNVDKRVVVVHEVLYLNINELESWNLIARVYLMLVGEISTVLQTLLEAVTVCECIEVE